MDKQMAIEILAKFEEGNETVALNENNTEWRAGSNLGPDFSDVDFADFCEILDENGLSNLVS